MIHDARRLSDSLGKPAMGRLVEGLRERLRLGRPLQGSITLATPSDNERSAIDQFLGRRPSSGTSLVIRLAEVERILSDGAICDSLAEAVEALLGRIENQNQAREVAARRWAEVFLDIEPALEDLPQYRPWLEQLRSAGLLKRLSGGDCNVANILLRQTFAVLKELPQPVVSLAEFATRVTGDSHALDAGAPLATLCLLAIARQHGSRPPRSAEARRKLWDIVGVVVDELSAPVLVLNLRADPATLVGSLLNPMADAGEPCHLTVRQLRRIEANAFVSFDGAKIYVCENVSVVAAAAQRLGRRCAPLICTAGQPASSVQLLLQKLREAGCRLLYHGDFDAAGIVIANMLMNRFGAEPWRMSIGDFVAAAASPGPKLKCHPVAAIWADELAEKMFGFGHAALEESVLDSLMADLRA